MARPRKATTPRAEGIAVGYVRVSTAEQADSKLGLEAQRSTIVRECERRGLHLLAIQEDAGISGKSMENRPALMMALDVLEAGAASVLVVAKLDRLTRSLGDLCSLMDRANRDGWAILSGDLAVDMTSAMGRAMAQMAGIFAELERQLIAQRTRDALAVKRAQGVTLGRPRLLPVVTEEQIVAYRMAEGLTFGEIARRLEEEGVTTPAGKRTWNKGTLSRICARHEEAAS